MCAPKSYLLICSGFPFPWLLWQVISHEVDTELDLYLIIASDGVWEFISNDQAVELVNSVFEQGKSAEEACKYAAMQPSCRQPSLTPPSRIVHVSLHLYDLLIFRTHTVSIRSHRWLIAKAAMEWRRHEGDYRDDISATVMRLPDVVKQLCKSI